MFWYIAYGLVIGFGLFLVWTRRFSNPFKFYMLFGKKGAGKTTTLCKIAFKHLARGWDVYSSEPIPGCYHIPAKDIGHFKIPERSVLLIDEVGLVWHKRNWKLFSEEVRRWFKYQRHRCTRVLKYTRFRSHTI